MLKSTLMTQTSEYARLSSYPYSTISDESNRGLCLHNINTNVARLVEQGKGFLYFSEFSTPQRCQVRPELFTKPKHPNDGRLSPGEAFAVQALGQEIYYFSNNVALSVPLDQHLHERIRTELKLHTGDDVGLIDFAEGMTYFGTELLNVFDLREAVQKGKNSNQIPPILLKRYKTPLELNKNIIKGQVVSSIVDSTNEKVERDIESSYHLSKVGPGNESDELKMKIKSKQRGIEFAALIYKQVLDVAFQEGLSLTFKEESATKKFVGKFKRK